MLPSNGYQKATGIYWEVTVNLLRFLVMMDRQTKKYSVGFQ